MTYNKKDDKIRELRNKEIKDLSVLEFHLIIIDGIDTYFKCKKIEEEVLKEKKKCVKNNL